MRIAQLKTAAICAIALNVTLIVIGSLLKAHRTAKTAERRWYKGRTEGTPASPIAIKKNDHSSTELITQALPVTLAKLPSPAEPKFSRTKWSDDFTFDNVQLALPPNVTVPDNLKKKDFVLGVPTIGRGTVSYLHDTLHSLIENLEGFSSLVIVVYIGEEDHDVADKIASGVKEGFPTETESGLIHVSGQ